MICPACQSQNDAAADTCLQCGRSLTLFARGTRIASRYEILDLLGKGGMGVVYKAHDHVLDEIVALKVLRADVGADVRLSRRFRSEIKLARRVSHPNVCRIHDYDEADGLSYISMAYVDGVDLRELLRQRGTGLPPEDAFPIALQIARGLQAIHETGVIHRDLKTPNIMRDSHGVVQVMDFGIAKDASSEGARGLTATGAVMGTPEYMSPEQCRGEKLDPRSDIYALGVVLFELFTGELPFRGDTLVATLFMHIRDPPPFDAPIAARLPAALVPVLRKALAKRPEERHANVAEFHDELHAAAGAPGVAAPAAPPVASGHDAGPTLGITGGSTAALAAPAAAPPAAAPTPPREQRADSRLGIPVDVVLARLDSSGAVLERERSLAEDVGRHGARVLTAFTGVNVGDVLLVEEVGGGFKSRATVRNEHKGADGVLRLGLEFLDATVPERLLPSEAPNASAPRPAATPPVAAPAGERRTQTRLHVPLDVRLRRGDGLEEQRTVADELSRGGARVITSLESINVGELVEIEEVGGDFRTRASVRHRTLGPDHVPRLGLRFLDRPAPDRLVGRDAPYAGGAPRPPARAGDGATRTPPAPAAATPGQVPATPEQVAATPEQIAATADAVARRRKEVIDFYQELAHKNHFEVLGLPRASSQADVRTAFAERARKFHPDKAHEPALADLSPELHAIFVRLGAAYDVLSKTASRAEYEQRLGRPRATPAGTTPVGTPPAGATPAGITRIGAVTGATPGAARVPDPDHERVLFERALHEGRRLYEDGLHWDAIQTLEPLLGMARTPAQRQRARVALAKAVLKNPRWVHRAEELLRAAVDEDPHNWEALFLLASIYRSGGLTQRAARLLRQVLELQPGHAAARAALTAIERAGRRGGGHV